MKLVGKVIYVISYENWGAMLMSKHHYAIQLAKQGNSVFFVNHPDKRKELQRGDVKLIKTEFDNLTVVTHRLIHPYFLKFKFKALYNILTKRHIRTLVKKVGVVPDVVWSFDAGNTLPIKYFPAQTRVFMPVDGPFGHKDERRSADKADVIISVTDRILATFAEHPAPKFRIDHGVADAFLDVKSIGQQKEQVHVGYSGSLVRNDLDIPCFLKIITSHPDKIFEFWGEIDHTKSNIHLPQDVRTSTLNFIETLSKLPNVILHGPVSPIELASGLGRMDVLLICYNIKNDQNHHKVLEYLATGKVVVSNYMSSYKDCIPHLLEMSSNPDNNDELYSIFDIVVSNLERFNSSQLQQQRKEYARQFSYAENIARINNFLVISKGGSL